MVNNIALEESGFTKAFETVKNDLSKKLKNKYNPQTRYDVYLWSMAIINEAIELEEFVPLKKYLFEKDLRWDQLLKDASSFLAKYHLEKHPEIDV